MTTIAKNSPCPCGSGKKYKRCCINKPAPTREQMLQAFQDVFNRRQQDIKNAAAIFTKYNTVELLKIFSLLQLQPANHGKNVRLESIIGEIIRNPQEISESLDWETLRKEINFSCIRDFGEDPPEEFFTENIIFSNGNNTVFPGISTGGTEIVQGLLNCILNHNILPTGFVDEVNNGISLILHVHDSIAKSLGYGHRMFKESSPEELFIPEATVIQKDNQLFGFSKEKMRDIAASLHIPVNTIDQFVFDWKNESFVFTDHDQNPLFKRPFIITEGEYVLVMPSAQLICLNEYIIRLAQIHGCLHNLLGLYVQQGLDEMIPYFGRMYWGPVEFSFTAVDYSQPSFLVDESLWRIDTNKLAYVITLTEQPDFIVPLENQTELPSKRFTEIAEASCLKIKKQFPSVQILLVCIINKVQVLARMGLALKILRNSDYHIFFSQLELQVLTKNWKFDRLTIWKYAKYLHMAEDKIRFAPLNTHYSKFKWYKRNKEAFFDPDVAPVNYAAFEFDIESEVRRKGVLKMDKLSIPFQSGNEIIPIACYRKEEYYPVYISQSMNYGILNNCLLGYSCPIWFMPAHTGAAKADIYINGILYWLNEMREDIAPYIARLGEKPIMFVVRLDNKLQELTKLEDLDNTETSFGFSISPALRQVDFLIPVQIVQFICSPANEGERFLMSFILDALGELMRKLGVGDRLEESERDLIIGKNIPFGKRKMISTATADRYPEIADIDVDEPRTIPKSDVSFILENQVKWLEYPRKIPELLNGTENKIKLFNDLVTLHVAKLKELISEFEGVSLLTFLMRRHEALIHEHAFRKINYPVKDACYSKYYDVYREFAKSESKLNIAGLSIRVLIEFVLCLMPAGPRMPNDDEVDMMMAHMNELILYGSYSDELQYSIRDMEVGLLPSGRIGIDRTSKKTELIAYSEHVYTAEFESFNDDFNQAFIRRNNSHQNARSQGAEKVNTVSKQEWGIGLYDLGSLSYALTHLVFDTGKSMLIASGEELFQLIKQATDFTDNEIESYLNLLLFISREEIDKPPSGFNYSEIYPWRYNRLLSYMTRPIIRLTTNDQTRYIISARHLWAATENLMAGFSNATLRVPPGQKGILSLMAAESAEKGKEFRQTIYHWLCRNTKLKVHEFEVHIHPKGLLKSRADKGDIDILAIDHEKHILYSIECKNTNQAKVAYEWRREIDNYLGKKPGTGLIQKHINRDKWLQENIELVKNKLELTGEYKIISLVVSKHILPTRFLKSIPMKILSYYELKKNGLIA